MNILDLDEAQGITVEMVREWAERNGWELRAAGLRRKDHGFVSFANYTRPDAALIAVAKISQCEGRSVQALLRDINPRMRKGLPSAERTHAVSGR